MKRRKIKKNSQKGVALLVVLMIMALMTTIAVSMANRMFVNFNRAESQVRYQQAYWYAQSVESLAKYALKESFTKEDSVTLSQPWAVQNQTYPLDGGSATGSVYDQQLIESKGVDAHDAEIAAASTWEYIDADDSVQSALGVEDSEYETRTSPYVVPNNFMGDISEWRAVNGVSRGLFDLVAPLLCAIPTDTLVINVNTLTEDDAPLLSALFHPNLSVEQATQLIADREPIDGWAKVEDFLAESALSGINAENREKLKQYLDIKSKYFELDTNVIYDSTSLRMRALLRKDDDGSVTVLRRRFGGVSGRNTDDKTQQ
jgi:general secretion pathway protein K